MSSIDERHQLQLLARSVGAVLNTYVEVHDRIFQEASTLRSMVKNIFGRGVPMADLLADAEQLIPAIESVQAEMTQVGSLSTLSPEGLAYLDLLDRYVNALRDTVDALVRRQRLLAEGARGRQGSPLTWEAFQSAEREYSQAVGTYKAIGAELNDASPLIFG